MVCIKNCLATFTKNIHKSIKCIFIRWDNCGFTFGKGVLFTFVYIQHECSNWYRDKICINDILLLLDNCIDCTPTISDYESILCAYFNDRTGKMDDYIHDDDNKYISPKFDDMDDHISDHFTLFL